jgi:hypothetical protein
LINNRQGGRRRGRGGQRGPNLGGGQPGNRQDNRQRGNAAQLLEKYKNMARDSQLAGDRVQTEYYLQFADHYFRVLSESRARFEDQRRQRGDDLDEDEDGGGEDELVEAGDEQASDDERPARGDRANRRGRERRPRSDERSAGDGGEDEFRNARVNGGGGDAMPFDALPPAIGREEADLDSGSSDEEPQRPKRRARAPRATKSDQEDSASA